MTAGRLTKTSPDEHQVVEFLRAAMARAAPGKPVEIVETHAARVFLAGDRALKCKKWIALPFLDFSMVSQRHAALARELELNKPHAPTIYKDLVSITQEDDGTLALDGKGIVCDWGLAMHRFAEEDVLLEIARRGPLDPNLADQLADVAARYHLTAPPDLKADATRRVGSTLEPLLDALRAAGTSLDQDAVERLADNAHRALSRLAPLLDARAHQGAIRRCHGDLHLGNIVLVDGHPVPFDALEFDETLATIDVLYDLAFLLMDLIKRGQPHAASQAFNRYIQRAPLRNEIEGLRTLPLFLAMRAAVRAVVALARARQDGADRAAEEAHARGLVALAQSFLTPPPPKLVAIGGFSGTGKSTLARNLAADLAPAPGALVLRSDVERKLLFGVAETERLSPDHYTEAVTEEVYKLLLAKAQSTLDAGHSVIVDAVFANPHERDAVAALAADRGLGFAGLWLIAPADVLIERVETRRGDASDAGADVVSAQLAYNTGKMTWTRVDARGSPEETRARALAQLEKLGIRQAPDGLFSK